MNFFCHTPPAPDPAREAAWRAALAPYYEELGLDPAHDPRRARAVRPFGAEAADVLEEFRPAVVSFHFGLPVAGAAGAGAGLGPKVLSTATTVEEARWLEARGVDAIIAQGLEAGGHRGMFLSDDLDTQVGTLALVPQVVAAVKVPVIAAGGIADARGVRGGAGARRRGRAGRDGLPALPRGDDQRRAPRRAEERGGPPHGATNVFTGRPARGIVNRLMRELGPMSPAAPPFPLAARGRRPAACQGREPGQRGLLAALVGAERQRVPGGARRGGHA